MERVTYWLLYGPHIIGSIRLSPGASDDAVRAHALMAHRRNPTLYADFPDVLPYEQERRIGAAEVRRYE